MQNSQKKEKISGYSYLMMLGHICNDMSQGALPAMMPFLVALKGIDYTAAAGLMFASNFLSSLIQPLLGMMADRRPMPWLMATGMLMSGLGITLIGFLDSYWTIFSLVMFAGLGSAMFHPEAGRMANCVAGEKKGRAIGIFAVGGNLGFVIGPVITTIVVSAWGLRAAAVLLIPVFIISSIFFSQNKNFCQFSTALTTAQRAELKNGDNENKDDWKGFGKLSISIFSRSIIASGIQIFIPLYWVGILMQPKELGSFMVTVIAIAAVIATLIGGNMADRFGFKKVIFTSYCLLPPLLVLLLMSKNVILATIFLVPMAMSLHIGHSPSVALGQKYLSTRLGLASGVTLGLAISVGGICTPLLGMIGDRFGLITVMYVITGISVIGFLGASWIKAPRR